MPDRVKEASFTWNWATNSDSDRSPGLSSAEAACLRTHQARHPVYLLRAGTSRVRCVAESQPLHQAPHALQLLQQPFFKVRVDASLELMRTEHELFS